ncbi:A73 protein [human gammaherpesvirus 4]|nr:A73 protein [human gammaherpesvirus 4]QHE24240.1 A73 protein [human gammaherpesvirus 4]
MSMPPKGFLKKEMKPETRLLNKPPTVLTRPAMFCAWKLYSRKMPSRSKTLEARCSSRPPCDSPACQTRDTGCPRRSGTGRRGWRARRLGKESWFADAWRMARYWGCAVKTAAQSAFSASTASPEEL